MQISERALSAVNFSQLRQPFESWESWLFPTLLPA